MAERVEKLTIEVGGRNRAGGVFAEVERSVDRLKARFGPRSFMKDLTEIAVGGGALAGISFVGRTFAELTKGVTKFADKLAEGKTSTVELVAELAKGLPIVGGFAQGFETMLSSLTGIGAEIRQINADVQAAENKIQGRAARAGVFGAARSAVDKLGLQNDTFSVRTGSGLVQSTSGILGGALREILQARGGIAGSLDPRILARDLAIAQNGLRNLGDGPSRPIRRQTGGGRDGPTYNMSEAEFAEAEQDYKNFKSIQSELQQKISTLLGELEKSKNIFSDFASKSGVRLKNAMNELADTLPKGGLMAALQAIVPGGFLLNLPQRSFPFSPSFGSNTGIPDPSTDPLQAGLAARKGAVGSALAMAEEALARMQAGRGGGGSPFATADTRRGITGVRSIGGGQAEMSAAEKELIKLITELKKEQEKSNKVSDEVKALLGPALENILKLLNPKSEL